MANVESISDAGGVTITVTSPGQATITVRIDYPNTDQSRPVGAVEPVAVPVTSQEPPVRATTPVQLQPAQAVSTAAGGELPIAEDFFPGNPLNPDSGADYRNTSRETGNAILPTS